MPVWPQSWFLALKWFSSSCSIVDPLMAQLVEWRPIDFMNVDIPRLLVWFWLERSALVAWGFPGGSDGKESACNAGDLCSILGSGRSPGEGNSYPLQYSCLENSMDKGDWRATVHGVAKSRTRLLMGCSPWSCKEFDTTLRLNNNNNHNNKTIASILESFCREMKWVNTLKVLRKDSDTYWTFNKCSYC